MTNLPMNAANASLRMAAIEKANDNFLAVIAAKQANSAIFTAKRRVEAANEAVKAGVVFG